MSEAPQNRPVPKDAVTRIIRISGGGFIASGLLIFFDLAGLAGLLGVDGDTRQILGAAFMFVGMMDLIIVPRVFEQMNNKK